MAKKVIIYTTRSCPYCKMEKAFLGEHKVPYEEKDVTEDAELQHEMVHKSGQLGVPVTDIEGEIIIGFDKEKLAQLLEIK